MKYNKQLGITEKDVAVCNDIDKLFDWKTTLIGCEHDIKNKMIAEYGTANIKEVEPDERFRSLHTSKRYISQFISIIYERIDCLRVKDDIALKHEYETFKAVVKNNVSKRKWNKINNERNA